MIRINLLAAERPAQKKRGGAGVSVAPGNLQLYLLLTFFLGGTLLLCGFLWWLKSSQIRELNSQIAAAQARQQQLQVVKRQVEALEQKRKTFQDKVGLIEKLRAQQSGSVHMLDEISQALPEFVWLNSLEQTGDNLRLGGQSATLTAIADFIANLQNAGPECGRPNPADRSRCWFPEVNLVSSATDRGGTLVTFNLTARFSPSASSPAAGAPTGQ
jgi:Tfp pilus assembly protein PilN